jgi:TRAP-type C4-dicarboxylate transport system permease small subunit
MPCTTPHDLAPEARLRLGANEPEVAAIEPLTGPPQSRVTRLGVAAVEIPAIIIILVMMSHIVAQAIGRKFGFTIPDTLETVEFWYMPLAAMLGFVSAHLRGENVVTDLLMQHLRPAWAQRALGALFGVACSLMCVGFAYYGWVEALHAHDIDKKGGTSGLVIWPVYFIVPVIFVILAFLHARDVASLLRSQAKSGSEPNIEKCEF